MAEKNFGVKKLDIIGSGTPTIANSDGGDLNINAATSTFSGNLTIAKNNAIIELSDPDSSDANYQIRNDNGTFDIKDSTNSTVKIRATSSYVTVYPNLNANNGLDVMGTITGDGNLDIADSVRHSGDINTKITFPANDTISFDTAGSERIRIKSDGSVGIGTDDPKSKLDVFEGTTGNQTAIRIGNSNTPSSANDKRIEFVDGKGTTEGTDKYTYGYIQGIQASQGHNINQINEGYGKYYAGDLVFGTKQINDTAPTERLRITSFGSSNQGRVGIGTTMPDEVVHIMSSPAPSIQITDDYQDPPIHHRIYAGGADGNLSIQVCKDPNGDGGRGSDDALFDLYVRDSRQLTVGTRGIGIGKAVQPTSDPSDVKEWSSSYKVVQIDKGAHFGGSNDETVAIVGTNNYAPTSETSALGIQNTYKYEVSNKQASQLLQYGGGLLFRNAASGTAGDTINFSDTFEVTPNGDTQISAGPGGGGGRLQFLSPSNTNLEIYHTNGITGASGANGYIDNHTGNLYIRNNVHDDDNGDIHIQAKSGEEGIVVYDDGVVALYTNGDLRFVSGTAGSIGNISYANMSPSADNTWDLGMNALRWDDVWATNGTIQTSDRNTKENILESDLGLDFINKLSPKSFKFEGKTRTHYGLIAQDVETVLGTISKSATDFAGFCKDTITQDADGTTLDTPFDRYGLRYTEFISPMIKAIQELKAENDSLKTRIAALEGS